VIASEYKSAIYSFVRHNDEPLVDNVSAGTFVPYANTKFCSIFRIGVSVNKSDCSLTTDPFENDSYYSTLSQKNFTVNNSRLVSYINYRQPSSKLSQIIFTPQLVCQADLKVKEEVCFI
jgi:hypothetical protein